MRIHNNRLYHTAERENPKKSLKTPLFRNYAVTLVHPMAATGSAADSLGHNSSHVATTLQQSFKTAETE